MQITSSFIYNNQKTLYIDLVKYSKENFIKPLSAIEITPKSLKKSKTIKNHE